MKHRGHAQDDFSFQLPSLSRYQSHPVSRLAPIYRWIDAVSLGLHRYWKNELVKKVNVKCGMKVLDCAGGTGHLTFRIINHMRKNNV